MCLKFCICIKFHARTRTHTYTYVCLYKRCRIIYTHRKKMFAKNEKKNFLVIKSCLKRSRSPPKRKNKTTGLDFTQSVVCFSSLMAVVEGGPKNAPFIPLVLLIFSVSLSEIIS